MNLNKGMRVIYTDTSGRELRGVIVGRPIVMPIVGENSYLVRVPKLLPSPMLVIADESSLQIDNGDKNVKERA